MDRVRELMRESQKIKPSYHADEFIGMYDKGNRNPDELIAVLVSFVHEDEDTFPLFADSVELLLPLVKEKINVMCFLLENTSININSMTHSLYRKIFQSMNDFDKERIKNMYDVSFLRSQ